MTTNDILFACVCVSAIYCCSITAIIFCALYGVHSFYSESMAQWMRYVSLILIDSAVAFLVTAIANHTIAPVSLNRKGKILRIFLFLWSLGTKRLLSAIRSQPELNIITSVMAGSFLVINCAGFLAWFLYLPPTPYDAACSAVYVAMAALLIREGRNGGGWDRVRGVAGALARAAVRKGLGVHYQGSKKI